jgi:hypothetical protein
MSNVLIGIIGVILFIGLALAGALFLGPRFQEAAANSDAAAATSTIQQIQSAYALKSVETGVDRYVMGVVDNMDPDYMKSQPINPTKAGRSNPSSYIYVPHINNDILNDLGDEGRPTSGRYVMMAIGTDTHARAVCEAMNRHLGVTSMPIVTADDRAPLDHIACGYNAPYYHAFGRLR